MRRRALLHLQRNVPLAGYTTIGLGGPAACFASCRSVEEVQEALRFAQEEGLPVQVLGGGSNIVFADEGFAGLVLRVALQGVAFGENGDAVQVTVAAGEVWDDLVRRCIERDLAGLECLSGIPGSAGATPVQNVGAYGQEVGEVLVSLRALERGTLRLVTLSAEECALGYRQSRFKGPDRGRYIILEVTLRLRPFGPPTLRYPELRRHLEERVRLEDLPAGRPRLETVRQAVLALRRAKSMLADPQDPHARSVGSFFLNPLLSRQEFRALERRWREDGGQGEVPTFPEGERVKVPAAWLVEQAGFRRGYRRGGVGVSPKHALALVNYGGSTRDLLALAEAIRRGVYARFGLLLEIEPTVVPPVFAPQEIQ